MSSLDQELAAAVLDPPQPDIELIVRRGRRRRTARRLARAGAIALVPISVVGALVVTAGGDGEPNQPAPATAPSTTVPSTADDDTSALPLRYDDLSPEELEQLREGMSESEREMFDRIMEYSRNDAFPVAGPGGGTAGYITNDARGMPAPQTVADLADVVDANGNRVGYWGADLGFLESSLVEAPGFDLAEYRAETDQSGP